MAYACPLICNWTPRASRIYCWHPQDLQTTVVAYGGLPSSSCFSPTGANKRHPFNALNRRMHVLRHSLLTHSPAHHPFHPSGRGLPLKCGNPNKKKKRTAGVLVMKAGKEYGECGSAARAGLLTYVVRGSCCNQPPCLCDTCKIVVPYSR